MPQNHELSTLPSIPSPELSMRLNLDQIVGNDACPCLGDAERRGLIMSALAQLKNKAPT